MLAYAAIGLLLIFTSALMNIISEYRISLGIVFIVYAGFRTMVTIQRMKRVNRG